MILPCTRLCWGSFSECRSSWTVATGKPTCRGGWEVKNRGPRTRATTRIGPGEGDEGGGAQVRRQGAVWAELRAELKSLL